MSKEEIKDPNKGLRFNTGKPRWGLVHYKSLEPMIRVLEYGANKYTISLELSNKSIESLCNKVGSVVYVKGLEELQQRDYVTPATISEIRQSQHVEDVEILDKLGLKICAHLAMKQTEYTHVKKKQNQGENTLLNTVKEKILKREIRIGQENGHLTLSIKKKRKQQTSEEDCQNMASLKVFTKKNVSKVVKYAELKKGFILIIAIKQGSTEVYFVVNATTQSDCLMTAFLLLKELSFISKNTVASNNRIVVSGDNNWMKGLVPREVLECMQRHLAAIMDGETHDKESGLPHIGHILCNAMFYSYFTEVHPEKAREKDNQRVEWKTEIGLDLSAPPAEPNIIRI